ncbi:PD40 domain-containing protein [Kribbella catacumbae]|uniref:PD40 domain-containing protein n=1 Tax=Kribbella catacumbae TaxID=460086 RepID=UPI0003762811|nr:PD40 domain-containing protein [Kribbella catacumbae]
MKKVLASALGMILLIGAAVLYVVQARGGGPAVNARPVVSGRLALAPGNLYFRNLAEGPDQGKLAAVSADDPDGTRQVGNLMCDRFATARSTSICLRTKAGSLPPLTELLVLGADLAIKHQQTLPGTPSRARVSPDGKIVNWTLFVSGDSYAASGFSTRTGLYEVDTGRLVKSIEEIPVFVDGRRYFASDVNYWGVTFAADGNRFYVTLGSKGKTYLIEADYRRYRGDAILQNAECPSLSPDGRRIAYKQKNADGSWRLAVLDLGSRRVTHPAEGHAIDDQPLWRDAGNLLYALKRDATTDIWSTPITATGTPMMLVPDAASPAIR